MIISNFVLCFCATAIIFLNSADAVSLDVAGVHVGVGEERRTHTFQKLTCPTDYGSGLYRCVHQVNERAFFLDRNYYSSGTEFCGQKIACNYNGKLRRLRRNQYPPNGTPCGDEEERDFTSVCLQRKCLAARNPSTAPTCTNDSVSE